MNKYHLILNKIIAEEKMQENKKKVRFVTC